MGIIWRGAGADMVGSVTDQGRILGCFPELSGHVEAEQGEHQESKG